MINHKYKYIFIRQPKNASSSINRALLTHMTSPSYPEYNCMFNDGVLSDEYKSGEMDKYHDYTVFTVVRNPWDKLVSGWRYCRTLPYPTFKCGNDIVNRNHPPELSFKETLKNLPRQVPDTEPNTFSNHDYHHITRSQISILLDSNGRYIPDVVLKVENLQQDFDNLCDIINAPHIQLEHRNRSDQHKHYTEYYDEETKQIVAEKYAKDIELFGYEFGD